MAELKSILGLLTPEMYGANASLTVAQNTAAFQRCIDEAPAGAAILLTNPYTLNGNLKYRGGRRFLGSKNAALTLAAGVTCVGMFVPYSWFTTTQAEMQTVTQADKFRPVFDGIYIDGNQANGGVFSQAALVMTSSEGIAVNCVFTNSSTWGLLYTPFNALGHTQDNGNNLFGNMFRGNRFSNNVLGGFYANDGDSAITTDGWFTENSITGGSVSAVHIESGQSWKVNGNQISSVLTGINIVRANGTVCNDNVINAFGNKTTLGNRFGINLGGLTTTGASAVCVGNSIEADANATALAGSSLWIAINYQGRSGGTNKQVSIANNTVTFVGFNGTTGKTVGIRQGDASGYNAILGVISGNVFVSDQNADGSMTDAPISLVSGHRTLLGSNANGPNLIAA